jgi:OOP family OmpA-OmpF porin
MKLSLLARRLSLAGIGCAIVLPAMAQNASGPYVGLSAGAAEARVDENRVATSLLGQGFTAANVSSDQRSTGYKLFGGWQFNRHLAVEAGYFDLGRSTFSATALPAGSLTGAFKVRGFNADVVGLLPFTDRLSGLARVGLSRAETKSSFAGGGGVTVASPGLSENANNVKVGVGLQYAVGSRMIVRGELERYRIADTLGRRADVELASVSLVFPFGGSSTGSRAAARPVEVVAQAPAPRPPPAPLPPAAVPEPVVMPTPAPVVAAPVVLRRVSYNAESIFGFDHADMRPEGRAALDTFAREVDGSSFDEIQVEGHADRLGTPAYNQQLSLQRAETVKSYLVTSGRLDPMKIRAVGRGESMPVTQPGDCKGSVASTKLIACLQPDRRVDIDVVGTR